MMSSENATQRTPRDDRRWWHQVGRGVLIAVGIIAFATTILGWWVVVYAASKSKTTAADLAMLAAFALLATAGFALFVVGFRRHSLGYAALGLLCTSVAPTGFAYIGNAVTFLAAVALWAIVIHRRLNKTPAPKPHTTP